jgi:DNA (cytosine-5)-methyltransferase 1
MGYTVFGINGLAPTLTATTSRHYERFEVDGRYRRLTSVEYARLQGFPDNHCAAASTYEQYGLYGNAVPPPMAEWCVGRLISGSLTVCPRAEPTLFEHSGAAGE